MGIVGLDATIYHFFIITMLLQCFRLWFGVLVPKPAFTKKKKISGHLTFNKYVLTLAVYMLIVNKYQS